MTALVRCPVDGTEGQQASSPDGFVSALADTAAITTLIGQYAELVDTGGFAGVGGLFADAVFLGSGGRFWAGTRAWKGGSGTA